MVFFRIADRTALETRRNWHRSVTAGLQELLVLVLLAASGLAQSLQPDDQPSKIRGTVTNSVTQAPIPRALVFSPDNRFAMLSDSEGRFEFTLPNESDERDTSYFMAEPHRIYSAGRLGRSISLMARKPGFLDDPNEQNGARGSTESDLTISLVPESLIVGRVALPAGDPALGITVQIFSREVQEGLPRWMPGMMVRANSAGEFRFAELLPGKYKLLTHEFMENDPTINLPGGPTHGFPPVYYPGAADFAAAATIDLAAGQTVQADISPVPQPYFAVRIPVANGDLNLGMNVSVEGRGPGYSLGYNPREKRIEGLLPNGNYVVEARTYGPNSAAGTLSFRVNGGPVEAPTMAMVPDSSITLDVKEEFNDTTWNGEGSWNDGKRTYALRGPRLYLQARIESADDLEQPGGGSLRPPTGPNDNSLVIDNVPPGRYWLRLNTSRGYVAAATMGGLDLLHQPLVVGAGSTVPIQVKMRDDSAEIDGTVTTLATQAAGSEEPANGGPQAWVYCVPTPESPGQFQQLAVSGDGKFTATMAPGDYRVLSFTTMQPNLPYRDAEAMRPYETKGPVVHLAPGQKVSVQVALAAGGD